VEVEPVRHPAVPRQPGTTTQPDDTGAPAPPLAVVLTCTDCQHSYEPTPEDFAAGRTGCPDLNCGGWAFSSALTVPPAAGGAR